jgi:hypothetical protein
VAEGERDLGQGEEGHGVTCEVRCATCDVLFVTCNVQQALRATGAACDVLVNHGPGCFDLI